MPRWFLFTVALILASIASCLLIGCTGFHSSARESQGIRQIIEPSTSKAAPLPPLVSKQESPDSKDSVRVCSVSGTGVPCNPLANIFSDQLMTTPLTTTDTDSDGKFSFYARPGIYNLQVSGNSFPAQEVPVAVLPTRSSTPALSTVIISHVGVFTFTLSGNLIVSGTVTAQQGISAPRITVGPSGGSLPPTPLAGSVTLFTGSDGLLYYEDSTGKTFGPLSGPSPSGTGLNSNPPVGSPIQYVTYAGNDNNDGLSWGTAKLTIMAAYDAMPNNGGTIFLMEGPEGYAAAIHATPIDGQGIWIMGPSDPNYGNPPPGWRRAKPHVKFIGVAASSSNAGSHAGGQVQILSGGQSRNQPCIWISGVDSGYDFENLKCYYTGRGILLGETSNNLRDGTANVAGMTFRNVVAAAFQSPTTGPTVDITGSSFWIYFHDCVFDGNYQAPTLLGDLHAAMLIDGTGNAGNYLIFVDNINTNGGGIKFIPGRNGGSLTVNGLTEEGSGPDIPPGVYLTSTSNYTQISLSNITIADPGPLGAAAVQIDGNGPAEAVLVAGNIGGGGSGVIGPATIMGEYPNALVNSTVSPQQMGQVGFFNGHVVGQTDASRRNFGPVAIRFPNIASSVASSWTMTQYAGIGTSTVTTGIPAPDGTNGAGRATSTSDFPQENLFFYNNRLPVNTGDYFIGGAWLRSAAPNGSASSIALYLTVLDPNTGISFSKTGYKMGAISSGKNEWTWQWLVYKMGDDVTSLPAQVYFHTVFQLGYPIEAYAPVLMQVPAGTVSDNEAYEIATNLSSFPDGLPPGTVSTLPGQTFAFGGTGTFFGMLSQSNTANRKYYFPDASGHVAFVDLAQTWLATQTFDSVNLSNPKIGGETLSHSPISIFPAYLPGAFTSAYTAATFTPEHAILVTRIEITAKTAPQSCAVPAVIRVAGSQLFDVALSSNNQSDSGPINLSMDGGTPIQIIAQIPAQGCTVAPQDINVVVHFRMQ